jgi:hypothetical protein
MWRIILPLGNFRQIKGWIGLMRVEGVEEVEAVEEVEGVEGFRFKV